MKEAKITAIVHHADSINSGLDFIRGTEPFYAWRIGEVNYYFNDLDNIRKICNRTLEAIEKIYRAQACADEKERARIFKEGLQ
jgi:hypothetical protein